MSRRATGPVFSFAAYDQLSRKKDAFVLRSRPRTKASYSKQRVNRYALYFAWSQLESLWSNSLQELTEWISAFEVAKRKALEDPASTEASSSSAPGIDPAFAISPPVAPEFAAKIGDGHAAQTSEDLAMGELFIPHTITVDPRR